MTYVIVNTYSGRIASPELSYQDAARKLNGLKAKGYRQFVMKPAPGADREYRETVRASYDF